jgi:hypothetical protein
MAARKRKEEVREAVRIEPQGGPVWAGTHGPTLTPGLYDAQYQAIQERLPRDARRFVMGFGPFILKGAMKYRPPPPVEITVPASMLAKGKKGLTVEQLIAQQTLLLEQIVSMANSQARYYHRLLEGREMGTPEYDLTADTAMSPHVQTLIASMQPQLPFRAQGVLFCGDMLERVWVNDIKVGKNSMLLSSNPVPAHSVDRLREIDIDTCNVGQLMTISVSNYAEKNLFFGGLLYGTALQ